MHQAHTSHSEGCGKPRAQARDTPRPALPGRDPEAEGSPFLFLPPSASFLRRSGAAGAEVHGSLQRAAGGRGGLKPPSSRGHGGCNRP